MTASDFESLLVATVGPVAVDDLKAILADRANHRSAPAAAVSWLADNIGLDVVVRALVDGYGPDSIVASMVEVGALEQAADATVGAPYWYANGEVTMADEYDTEHKPSDAEPVYRIGGDRG